MRGRPADDKQKPNGGMIRKQFIVFPVVSPLSPDLRRGLYPELMCLLDISRTLSDPGSSYDA